ncbi:hypothetical protein LZ30DRAFT_125805 [Colletotrichum cereale]|nr:hypothetical protein LZ30DRAFT_125805 [Colletotrichum cereale]
MPRTTLDCHVMIQPPPSDCPGDALAPVTTICLPHSKKEEKSTFMYRSPALSNMHIPPRVVIEHPTWNRSFTPCRLQCAQMGAACPILQSLVFRRRHGHLGDSEQAQPLTKALSARQLCRIGETHQGGVSKGKAHSAAAGVVVGGDSEVPGASVLGELQLGGRGPAPSSRLFMVFVGAYKP